MRFLKKLFKKTVPKVIAGIFILVFLLSIFVFWGWYVKQVNKLWGLYYVNEGDKAYRSHKLEKAIKFYKQGLENIQNILLPVATLETSMLNTKTTIQQLNNMKRLLNTTLNLLYAA